MLRRSILILMLFVWSCSAPPPTPEAAPATPPPPPAAAPAQEPVVGVVRVTATSLNVRRDPWTEADVMTRVKKGTALSVLLAGDSWTKVRLDDGTSGWVASRFVSRGGAKPKTASRAKKGCPPDSDFAFVQTPTLAFSDRDSHGLVVVEATVNTQGVVTATKVISNTTGDETLAFLAEREIKSATFAPPIRNCVPRAFIFTYKKTF